MAIERGTGKRGIRRVKREDPVVIVRRALQEAEVRAPLFPGEEDETRAAVMMLKGRLQRLKSIGPEFADVELSVYARRLLPGSESVVITS